MFEQRPFLGGRATSYVLPDGEHVDNCQHVTLGCCTNLEDFYRRVGAQDKIRYFDRLLFQDPQGRTGTMQAGLLPAPLHMAGSFLTFAPLSRADKKSIASAMFEIVARQGPHRRIWKRRAAFRCWSGCGRESRRRARLSDSGAWCWSARWTRNWIETDARFGVDVFWKGFLSNRKGYRMGVPAVPLAELYDGCKVEIERRGGEVNLRMPVRVD